MNAFIRSVRAACAAGRLTLALVLIAAATARAGDDQANARLKDLYQFLDLFASCVTIVQSDYAEEINPTNLVYGALHGMMRSLDPHSEFMEAEETEALKIETEGEFSGIGIEIGLRDDYLTVIAPIEGSPAFRAGLMPNDRIIKINDTSTRDMSIGEGSKLLRGKKGTKVRVGIYRALKDKRETKDFTITRDTIRVQRVRDACVLDPTNRTGYVRVTAFDRSTADELGTAIEGLVTQGIDSLILDLRNNGGGLLSEAVDLASMFLDATQTVVSTRGRIESQNQLFTASADGPKFRMPMAVLVNGASASASEIVCAAIRDNHRGVVVGSRTFGKGSVQTVLPVGNGCSLRLTTAKYYTPSGECIHGTGIFPTVEVKISIDDEIKLIEKRSSSFTKASAETMTKEERAHYDELKTFRDAQLDRAMDVLAALRFLSGSANVSFAAPAAPAPPAPGPAQSDHDAAEAATNTPPSASSPSSGQ